MVFSSITFIYYFLPIVIISYFLTPKKYRNYILLIFSLFFYTYGEKYYLILLFFSCFFNYIIGLLISNNQKKSWLILGIIINLGLLAYFKYVNFFIDNFNNLFNLNINTLNIVLPLGISFFTFQNISYLVDVYRKEISCQKNVFLYLTYITFFPQLIAGPIVRYKDINKELVNRQESYSLFREGVNRFLIGLGKKVLLANVLYEMCSSLQMVSSSVILYWLLALAYTFQIYFDFSGYSDMAIGLGKMFGFNFLENFNYPLIATSVTDFWRRWHISLSSFFRDYVYITLGGNRVTFLKMLRNILIVWFLTGFWHGASWNFILWGLYFFFFLLIEKLFLLKHLKNKFFSWLYTFVVVMVGFIIFNTTNLNELWLILRKMFGYQTVFINMETIYYLKNYLIILIISLLGMTSLLKKIMLNLKKGKYKMIVSSLEIISYLIILVFVTASLISNSFNPFIYFRF